MGYTHYWGHRAYESFTDKEFKKLKDDVLVIIKAVKSAPYNIDIDYHLYEDEIIMNAEEMSLQCEDLCLTKNLSEFQFCKTRNKPYDIVVTAVLIAAEVIVKASDSKLTLDLRSDGSLKDWAAGINLYESCFPKVLETSNICVNGELILT